MRGRGLPLLTLAAAIALPAAASCSNGVKADVGADAYMQVGGAQFVRGPMPEGSPDGPAVVQLDLIDNNIWPGLINDPIGGALAPNATAAAIGLQGDKGYWVLVAGPPNVATPDDPSFGANAAFAMGIVPGNYTLVARAIDAAGHFGPPATQTLFGIDSPTHPPPIGHLVATLAWDTESNLDLHVVDPTGAEIYWGAQSSQPPFPMGDTDGGSYGYVDDDSNANCVIDGRRREDAIWPQPPPPGQYTVRVDTGSLCGQPMADWKVSVVLEGRTIAQASGIAVDADTRGSHGAGAGVLALQFAVP